MAEQQKGRHTARYVVYRAVGALALGAAVAPFFVWGLNVASLAFAAIDGSIGSLLFLSARAAERNERRAHFTYSSFFSSPLVALTKVVVFVLALVMCGLVIPQEWIAWNTRWWALGAIMGLGILAEALSDWREVRRSIHVAVAMGNLARVDKLLAQEPELVHRRGAYGRTPLHLAAALGHTNIAAVLITNGADVTTVADGGWTALHWASMVGRDHLVRRLVDEGADVNARAEDGTMPLNWALRNGHEEVAAILRLNGAED